MNHIYTPYKEYDEGNYHARKLLNGEGSMNVWFGLATRKWYAMHIISQFNTCKEAMTSLDTYLLSQGHILLTEEQYEKVKAIL